MAEYPSTVNDRLTICIYDTRSGYNKQATISWTDILRSCKIKPSDNGITYSWKSKKDNHTEEQQDSHNLANGIGRDEKRHYKTKIADFKKTMRTVYA